jgi:hypothetical protein
MYLFDRQVNTKFPEKVDIGRLGGQGRVWHEPSRYASKWSNWNLGTHIQEQIGHLPRTTTYCQMQIIAIEIVAPLRQHRRLLLTNTDTVVAG